jgi:hypothetical protein
VIDALREAGFAQVSQYNELGIFTEYNAIKPS